MLFWIVGGVIGLVGLVVVARALWGDRARGRKRCGRCWYSMEGVNGLTCPECGRAAKGERGLLRTRRRWWRAVGGVVVMGVGAMVAAPGYVNVERVAPWLPRQALLMLARFGDRHGPAYVELRARAEQTVPPCANWADWEMRWFVREVAGDETLTNRWTRSPFGKRPGTMSSRDVLIALGPRLKRAVVELLDAYRLAQDAESDLLDVFELVRIEDERVVEAIARRLHDPTGTSSCRRLAALLSIIGPGDRRVLIPSLHRLLGAGSGEHACALRALTEIDPTGAETLRALEAMAAGPDDATALEAIEWMARMKPVPMAQLEAAMANAPIERRREAVRRLALGRINHCVISQGVLSNADVIAEPVTRWWAVVLASGCAPRPPELDALLVEMARADASRDIRVSAMLALASPPVSDAAFAAAAGAIHDDQELVRQAAVRVVGKRGGLHAVELLAGKLNDPHPEVAAAAHAALEGLRSMSDGTSGDAPPASAERR